MKNIYMIGDSTMQYNNYSSYPQTGWGQVLQLFLHEDVLVHDFAKNGRSTKSFIDEGRFQMVLDKLQKGDFVICQFGHNDEKSQDPTRYTTPFDTYTKNLEYMYNEVKKRECGFVLATSITRRKFENGKCINSHGDYPRAMMEFAAKNNITCIDLNTLTMNLYSEVGEEGTKKFHMIFGPNIYPNYPEGKDDSSHLRYDGAVQVAELFTRAINATNDPINELFYNADIKEAIDWAMLKD